MKNKPVVIGIDHGYGNIKTAHCCFRTGIMPIDGNEPVFSSDILTYDSKSYGFFLFQILKDSTLSNNVCNSFILYIGNIAFDRFIDFCRN